MCGINGFNFSDQELIGHMNSSVAHRGPDSFGIFTEEGISLGHRRLSILDLSPEANQPMYSQDKRLVIVFNGEIYNFRELRDELSLSYDFKTKGDTEIILAAYQKWGETCVKKFNGIFAFAIWDRDKKKLFLTRDHLGVKPLYYYHNGEKLIFSSEIKSILAHNFSKKIDEGAVGLYFYLLHVPEPLTMVRNIYKLPPAHYAILKNNKLSLHRYWSIDSFDTISDKNEARSKIKSTLKSAVKKQLISDRPVGLYLSGGIDSTVLLGIMSELTSHPVRTFSVGFDVKEQAEKFNADFNLAQKTSQYFGSIHEKVILSPKDVLNNFEKIIWHGDDLVANHTQPAMYVLSELAKKKVAVVLAGDGGDELFAGYDRYYLNRQLDRIQMIPNFLRSSNLLRHFLGTDLYNKINTKSVLDRWLSFMSQKENVVSRFLKPDFNHKNTAFEFLNHRLAERNFPALNKASSTKLFQYLDLQTWLVDDALNRVDRMSMAHGIEERVPILDKDLVELAMSVPAEYNLDTRIGGKKVFKEALREYIPSHVYDQPKRGWFSPMSKWLRGDLKDWAYDILSPSYNPDMADWFDFKEINNILDKHISGEKYALNTIWSLISFQVWKKKMKI
ncbi:MAG: asparagine synthase (glutamine-hydrolyzing) [bacterium]|nr:asparagine synthase (glutamine-hydrolyzing) [bacterium]